MQELYELKEKLCKELKNYGSQNLSTGSLDIIDKLSHTVKNLDKIIEKYQEEEYSNGYRSERSMARGSYGNGGLFGNNSDGSYGYSNEDSYARNRDSMGRYSRENEPMMHELKRMMDNTKDSRIRNEMQSFIDRIGRM